MKVIALGILGGVLLTVAGHRRIEANVAAFNHVPPFPSQIETKIVTIVEPCHPPSPWVPSFVQFPEMPPR